MSWFTELLEEAGVPTLIDNAGETLTLTTPASASRTVVGIVNRGARQSLDGFDVSTPFIEVTLKNDATTGIATSEAVTDFQIAVAERVGGTAVARGVKRIVSHDAACLTVELN